MLEFKGFNIIKIRKWSYLLSAVIIVAGLANIGIHKGLKMGIDFAGGNMIQIEIKNREVTISDVRNVLIGTGYGNNVQRIDDPIRNLYILRTLVFEKNNDRVISEITDALRNHFGSENIIVERVDIVGPRISKYLMRTSYVVMLVAILLILMYTSFRFRFRFGVTAIIALVHDVLVMVSFISLFNKEMDTFILAAILTIIGYSLNDTIVVFDRARENLKSTKAYEDFEGTMNRSVLQSLSRTVITSVTTLLAVISLYIFGGSMMRNFAFALIVGIIAGTYSSIFIATALVVDWHAWKPEKVKKV
ncbi:MAG: protein translocase subunit SecF [Spirochaetota bacterium]